MKRVIKVILVITTIILFNYKNPVKAIIGRPYSTTCENDQCTYDSSCYTTYCMSPSKGLPANQNDGLMQCIRKVNPSFEKTTKAMQDSLDVAVIRAYQQTHDKKSNYNMLLMYRWISSAFGWLDVPARTSASSYISRYIFTNALNGYWDLSSGHNKNTYEAAKDAIDVGNLIKNGTSTYTELVENGTIWLDQWEFEEISTVETEKPNTIELTFRMKVKDGTSAPEKIEWSRFAIYCLDGYDCSNIKRNDESDTSTIYTLKINTSNGSENSSSKNDRKYGLQIKTYYKDARNPYSHLYYIKPYPPYDEGYQKMIMVTPDDYNRSLVNVNWEGCKCEIKDDEYTGNFIYTYKKENDEDEQITFPITDEEKKEKYKCPDKETCHKPYNCQVVDNKYYGLYSKHFDNLPVDEETYRNECLHICEVPSEENGNAYYCTEEEYGEGGKICTEKEYFNDCVCPTLKEECASNPQSNSCIEYNEKCPNCNPTISLTKDCNNFDIESEYTGIVSDINEISSECNPDINRVKACVINNSDLTDTSYEATNELNNNPYCKVWCKESYKFTVPTAKYSKSGGYFTINAKISGTRDCYVSSSDNPDNPIDETKFISDLAKAQEKLIENYNEYSKWNVASNLSDRVTTVTDPGCTDKTWKVYHYEWNYEVYDTTGNKSMRTATEASGSGSCEIVDEGHSLLNEFKSKKDEAKTKLDESINELNTVLNNYNNCTSGWTNNMNFNPEIDFWYQEDYIEAMEGTLKEATKEDEQVENIYCMGDTDYEYNCLSGKTIVQNENIPESILKNQRYITCNTLGCNITSTKVSKAKWIQKSKTNTSTYEPNDNISTYTQYGTIKIKESGCTGSDCQWTNLPSNILPIQLKTKTGVFPFKFTFKNIGQSNSLREELGRLMGNEISVINEFEKQNDKLKCFLEKDNEKLIPTDGEYTCHYINNCDNCGYTCENDNCSITNCASDSCILPCDTCIYDGYGNAFKYRTVSLNNLFPNSCDDNNTNCRNEGYNWDSSYLKASITKKEINNNGQSIYDNPEYSYTITPSNIRAIKAYNKLVGSYSNNIMPDGKSAINCDTVNYNGINYRVRCTSNFLSLGQKEGYFTEKKRSEEFTLWTDTDNCKNGDCLSKNDGIGPSWK